jgi:transposase-like protein
MRNSLKYIPYKHKLEFLSDLKLVYKESTKEIAQSDLDSLVEKWAAKYPMVTRVWTENWDELS